MINKLLVSAIAMVFFFINANVSAQNKNKPERQYGDIFEYNRITIQISKFANNSDTIKKVSPKEALVDSAGEMLHNSIFFGILSVNYSRILRSEKTIFTVGGGLSFVPAAFDAGGVGLMAEATVLTGGIKHFFEPGILMYFDSQIFAPMVRFGYRYQDPVGFLFRAGLLFTYLDGITVLPALSIGYSF